MGSALLARAPTVGGNRSIAEWLEQPRREPAWRRGLVRAAQALESPTTHMSFREFVERANPRFLWYRHCVSLAAVLQRAVDDHALVRAGLLDAEKALRRIIIEEPPRHGKSEEVSRLFAAYWLYRFPDEFAAIATYASDLAYTLSRAARTHYAAVAGGLSDEAAAVKHWETGKGGGLWACGVGGPATGKGWHLGIIDDPVKNAKESQSEATGRTNREWYQSTWYNREEPGGVSIVMHTRWPGPGDLIGFLLTQEAGDEDDQPERWHIVHFEAIKEAEPPKIPKTCTLEPDGRAVGEALCPERYPLARLNKIKAKSTEFFWGALFQQRPRPRGGGMFPREKAKIEDAVPVGLRWIRYWDKAGTEDGGANTAGVKMAVAPDGLVWVGDCKAKQLGSDNRKKLMRQVAELDGVEIAIWVEQEPGSSGKDSSADDVKLLAGFNVNIERPSGDKLLRADPFAAQWQAGNVRLLRGEWNESYLDEMESQPHGKRKDRMDASSGAYNKHTLGAQFFIV